MSYILQWTFKPTLTDLYAQINVLITFDIIRYSSWIEMSGVFCSIIFSSLNRKMNNADVQVGRLWCIELFSHLKFSSTLFSESKLWFRNHDILMYITVRKAKFFKALLVLIIYPINSLWHYVLSKTEENELTKENY